MLALHLHAHVRGIQAPPLVTPRTSEPSRAAPGGSMPPWESRSGEMKEALGWPVGEPMMLPPLRCNMHGYGQKVGKEQARAGTRTHARMHTHACTCTHTPRTVRMHKCTHAPVRDRAVHVAVPERRRHRRDDRPEHGVPVDGGLPRHGAGGALPVGWRRGLRRGAALGASSDAICRQRTAKGAGGEFTLQRQACDVREGFATLLPVLQAICTL